MAEMGHALGNGEAIVRAVDHAFLTAHLLTGSLQRSEEVALRAIDSWNPREEAGEALIRKIVDAAGGQIDGDSPDSDASGAYLPDELKAVLRLAPRLRHCFVLRILEGLPAQACAQLLHLQRDEVDDYTSAALHRLAAA